MRTNGRTTIVVASRRSVDLIAAAVLPAVVAVDTTKVGMVEGCWAAGVGVRLTADLVLM